MAYHHLKYVTQTLWMWPYTLGQGDYGIQLQSGVFATEILGSPAVVGFVEPGGKAEK